MTSPQPDRATGSDRRRLWAIAAIAAAVVVLVAAGVFVTQLRTDRAPAESGSASDGTTSAPSGIEASESPTESTGPVPSSPAVTGASDGAAASAGATAGVPAGSANPAPNDSDLLAASPSAVPTPPGTATARPPSAGSARPVRPPKASPSPTAPRTSPRGLPITPQLPGSTP